MWYQKFIFLWLYFLFATYARHEVVNDYIIDKNYIKPQELVIFQYDNRYNEVENGYWSTAARWNQRYAMIYNHIFIPLTMKGNCTNNNFLLSPVWCKVKAMVEIHKIVPYAKAYLYLDSDAIIIANYSISSIIGYIQQNLNWDFNKQPLAVNQDGPGWPCKHTLNHAYTYCLNSGTIFWIKNQLSYNILSHWWKSSSFSLDSNKFQRNWRLKWPWEQAQLYYIYEKYKDNIMRLSFPDLPYMPWNSTRNPRAQYPTDTIEPWCWSHMPGANCFIQHHCQSNNQKLKIYEIYDERYRNDKDIKIHPIEINKCPSIQVYNA